MINLNGQKYKIEMHKILDIHYYKDPNHDTLYLYDSVQ